MKDCCKTGNESKQKKSNLKKWFSYGLYAFIGVIILGVIVLQILGK
ncbi:hypothetical protein [Frigoriflavimonas asaccharolytica]|uniref:Uncharacterized protein n=1 Tax=Frigoriflavimonas asaccharolytica TaxID=2735899 RepID=A0A8J8G9H4_9FLAO|nr:hypothetical protein [Frigoriflavimonas asaccharolytica]NRS93791.1 hypothetical protein [Frigoriflavimonas asaccharolytica]